MLKIEEIHELIKLIDESTIDEFTYENEGAKIKLKKNKEVVQQVAAQAPVAPVQAAPAQQAPKAQAPAQTEAPAQEETASENLHKITSPMVGTFYASSSPEADPYVTTGSKVKENSVVCIVEAMKLFNEIEAEVKGEIVEVLAENGQLVEFGQPLFLVKAE
ncbi:MULTISPECIES: acetyl-CoA carboxylase biotin carboxyl carrier protein [Bacillus]|jgi:acetyl-CoA carboxylase biotin carboxyl carrier protein|uniref:acetyl-CoA carboxylase biotin carboxyl carrier protein n=1 Tax=Bacillus TaxID=1386 RepID=UPI00059FE0BC|nr:MULTISPECIES: acetyl-CoA carboxylase biotin carboxyl carrier protein [Bacillus]AMM89543.1 acetyl-CoA carboxylase [Bacillus pumilus]KQL38425.1 acetyl-CoA carboxylase biotin carboxyl carrier protein subunit [Bacillus sp. FJAT-21955]KJF48013.1 acetyl-CoA carboxylase [Bacillus altitudinis]MBR0578246.1 acetyl-CoA carboxylase biotin carboxyl carrier protein [Bacillus altitudinis A23-8]MBU8653359.1 acetyl-CoA carboxylase biotin carboxyl carrier protein [Bacillus altitudinis]